MKSLAAFVLVLGMVGSVPARGPDHFLDLLGRVTRWKVYGESNPAKIESLHQKSGMRLSLGRVPSGWPYQYQWSGAKRRMQLDLGRYNVIVATVPVVQNGSYAHLEIAILDPQMRVVKTMRSETITRAGKIVWDLRKLLDPASYNFEIRLIVGGSNSGCSVTYDSLRVIDTSAP